MSETNPKLTKVVPITNSSTRKSERTWADFLTRFDDAVCEKIEKHQAIGLISEFDARPVARALNRMDASMVIDAFGRHPRNNPEPVKDALIRIWMSSLYPSISTVNKRMI